MFSQACVKNSVHGGGHVWQGACMTGHMCGRGVHGREAMHGRGSGCVWWGACMVGGCVWQGAMCSGGRGHLWQRACVTGGVCGTGGCIAGGHVWQGVVHGRGCAWQGACMAKGGHVWQGGMHGMGAWPEGMCGMHVPPQQILHDTVNERAVHILLECILVIQDFAMSNSAMVGDNNYC